MIERQASVNQLEHRDAALLQSMVFGVLRHVVLLDHWLEQLCNNQHLETRVHWQLRLGLAQLLLLDHAPHAAVNETVDLSDGRARGLVNAVLRRALREKEALLKQTEKLPTADKYSHPDWLVERWEQQLGPVITEQLCAWNQQPAPTYIRLNQLHPERVTLDEAAAAEAGLKPVTPAGFYLAGSPPASWLQKGQCYAQDPSTAHACLLLDPQPGETVLDACAAPGGKTAYLAQIMENRGRLIACDSSGKRLKRMQDNLYRLHADLAQTVQQDWTQPLCAELRALTGSFDRILVDAPCSNTGVMRRRIDVRWRLEPEVFAEMTALQISILRALYPLLKPGGVLVYSTCSIDAEENQGVVDRLLAELPGLKLVKTHVALPWVDGTDGAFAALLQKSDS